MAFVMDVSGSMSRFNGQDGRLDRLLQCTALVRPSPFASRVHRHF